MYVYLYRTLVYRLTRALRRFTTSDPLTTTLGAPNRSDGPSSSRG
jgi:hypothetical protein